MKYILVDYENVSSKGLDGLNQVEKTDEIIVLYSQNMPNVPIDMLDTVQEFGSGIFKKVLYIGHNALDNVLCILIGLKMEAFAGSSLEIVVISKDKIYDKLKERIESTPAGPRKAKTSYKRYVTLQEMIWREKTAAEQAQNEQETDQNSRKESESSSSKKKIDPVSSKQEVKDKSESINQSVSDLPEEWPVQWSEDRIDTMAQMDENKELEALQIEYDNFNLNDNLPDPIFNLEQNSDEDLETELDFDWDFPEIEFDEPEEGPMKPVLKQRPKNKNKNLPWVAGYSLNDINRIKSQKGVLTKLHALAADLRSDDLPSYDQLLKQLEDLPAKKAFVELLYPNLLYLARLPFAKRNWAVDKIIRGAGK
ncbi:hypothetical protein IM774_11525 [Erysipelotrichaceae bacterium RD49]|nr:hypothetical protein [Erysipelotrichaceae bacterium RD49]